MLEMFDEQYERHQFNNQCRFEFKTYKYFINFTIKYNLR